MPKFLHPDDRLCSSMAATHAGRLLSRFCLILHPGTFTPLILVGEANQAGFPTAIACRITPTTLLPFSGLVCKSLPTYSDTRSVESWLYWLQPNTQTVYEL